jgi:hypothetical protein
MRDFLAHHRGLKSCGLGNPDETLSKHQRSRQETGDLQRKHHLPVIEFRASIVTGPSSNVHDLRDRFVRTGHLRPFVYLVPPRQTEVCRIKYRSPLLQSERM